MIMKKITIILGAFVLIASSCRQPTKQQMDNNIAEIVIKQQQSDCHQMISIERFDSIAPYSEGLMMVRLNDLYGFVDTIGQVIICLLFDDARSFSENRAAVKLNGKWGFINKTGETIIPFKYDLATSFNEGEAFVRLNDDLIVIDTLGIPVFRFDWQRISEDLQPIGNGVQFEKQ